MHDKPLSIALIDPSLFSLSYDFELGENLTNCGHSVCLHGRRLRRGEDRVLPQSMELRCSFYGGWDRLSEHYPRSRFVKVIKALSHILGLLRLMQLFSKIRPDIVHLQWSPFPLADRVFCRWVGRTVPIIFTAHNTIPSHGVQRSSLQTKGYAKILMEADRVIVHLEQTRKALVDNGLDADRIEVVNFPPIPIRSSVASRVTIRTRPKIVMFGTLKPYKGVDLLIEAAINLMQSGLDFEVQIAGRAFFDLSPLQQMISNSGYGKHFLIEDRFLAENEIFDMISNADIAAFPYREIDGSGAFASMQNFNKAIVVTDVGMFSDLELPAEIASDYRVHPGSVQALQNALGKLIASEGERKLNADAMAHAIDQMGNWRKAAEEHTEIYLSALEGRK